MQNYLAQLIADIQQAAKNLPPKPYYDIPPEAEGIEYVIEWENALAKPMQEWFGIAKENFPPPEKLTDDQLAMMVDELLKLWDAWRFEPILPENLPDEIAYKALTGFFDKPVAWVSEGELQLELCDLNPDDCPFTSEYCMCKDLEDEMDMDSNKIYPENAAEIAILNKEIAEIEAKSENEFLPQKDMDRYVELLLDDMQDAAHGLIGQKKFPDNVEIRSSQSIKELVENPFVTLQELTNIQYNQLPDHTDMDGLQTRKVLRAMLQMLDAFNLKVYYPEAVPHEIKYEALRDNWDNLKIKYLHFSGDDIDLCTGDPTTCPFGEYCHCVEDLPDDKDTLPKKEPPLEENELPF